MKYSPIRFFYLRITLYNLTWHILTFIKYIAAPTEKFSYSIGMSLHVFLLVPFNWRPSTPGCVPGPEANLDLQTQLVAFHILTNTTIPTYKLQLLPSFPACVLGP